jgi:L-glutamine-phosphate cytidylyltransferase
MRLIILAAGLGSRLAPLTDDKPKCLVPVGGRPLLEWTLEAAKTAGIEDVVVVGGYRAELLKKYGITLLINENYATTNMVQTLFLARAHFGDGFIMSYGDIAYSPSILERLTRSSPGVHVVVDMDWKTYWEKRFDNPLQDAETLKFGQHGEIVEIGNRPSSYDEIEAQYIGLVAFNGSGVQILERTMESARVEHRNGLKPFGCPRAFDALYMTDLLQGMISLKERVMPLRISGQWVEVDSVRDLTLAETLIREGRLT